MTQGLELFAANSVAEVAEPGTLLCTSVNLHDPRRGLDSRM